MLGFSLQDNGESCPLGKTALEFLWHENFPNGALMDLLRTVAAAPCMIKFSFNMAAKTTRIEMSGQVSTETPGLEDNLCVVLNQLAGLETLTLLVLTEHQPEGAMMQASCLGEKTSTAYITVPLQSQIV